MAIEENVTTIQGSLCRTAGDLSVTVCTGDADVLAEVGVLFIRLADIARKAAGEFGAVTEPGPVMFVHPNEQSVQKWAEEHVIPTNIPEPTNVFAPNPPTPVPAPPVVATPAAPGIFPVTPLVSAPISHNTAELDGEGLPWDRRIHASTKTRRQSDDTWKLLKGLDPAIAESVKAELRAAMAAIVVPAHVATEYVPGADGSTPVVPHPPVAAPIDPVALAFSAVVPEPPAPPVDLDAGWPNPPAPPVAPAPPVLADTPAPPAPPVAPAMSFPMLVAAITSNQQAGKITPAQVKTVCESFGLASLPLIASRPELIPQLHEALAAIWGAS